MTMSLDSQRVTGKSHDSFNAPYRVESQSLQGSRKRKHPDHFAREGSDTPYCYKCGHPGHVKSKCTAKLGCTNCGEPGHKLYQCPKEMTCHMCGKTGHRPIQCTSVMSPDDLAALTKCLHSQTRSRSPVLADFKIRFRYRAPYQGESQSCQNSRHVALKCTTNLVRSKGRESSSKCGKARHSPMECTSMMSPEDLATSAMSLDTQTRSRSPSSSPMDPKIRFRYRAPYWGESQSLQSSSVWDVRDVWCKKCKLYGHFARKCPHGLICRNCRQPGHNASKCTTKRKESSHKAVNCHNEEGMKCIATKKKHVDRGPCKRGFKQGHIVSGCTYEKACKICPNTGHMGIDCPERSSIRESGGQ